MDQNSNDFFLVRFPFSYFVSYSKQHARHIKIPLDVIRPLAHIRIYRVIRIRQTTVTMTSAMPANTATIRGACGGIRGT